MIDQTTRKKLSAKIDSIVQQVANRQRANPDDYEIAQEFDPPEISVESSDVRINPKAVKEYLRAHLDYQRKQKLNPFNSPRKVYFDNKLKPLMADIDNGWFGSREFYPAAGSGSKKDLLERAKKLAYISVRNYSAYKD